MSSVISSSSANYTSLFAGSAVPNWLGSTITAIQNEQNQGGLLGMLQNAGGDGSINSFLGNSTAFAGNLATIAQTSVTNAGSLAAQIAQNNQQQANAKKLQASLDALSAQQAQVAAKNVLDPLIYFTNGSTLDTTSNILTMQDGTQYDTATGLKYVDPASILQLGGGAFLNTSTNIMTLADGTQIDTVTGLKVSPSA